MQIPSVLILDGRQIYCDLLGVLFEKSGFDIRVAANVGEALGMMRERNPDLLLMDIAVGGTHGLEFLERLRQNAATRLLPVIILTDICDRRFVIKAASLGIRDYILRDCFSSGRLIARARQLVANSVGLAPVPRPPATSVARADTPAPAAPSLAAAPVQKARGKGPAERNIAGAGPAVSGQPASVVDITRTPKLLTREQTLERLDQVISGKTIAGVVAQVIAVASSPNADLSDVVRVIQSDPILASRVLNLANSAATGARGRVNNIEDATRTVGVRGIQNMAISIGIFGAFPPDEADGFNSMRCWQHSFAVAELMSSISRQRNPELEGLNHLVGLCHDLGETILRQHFMSEYDQILQFAVDNHHSVHAVESIALGIRHPELISRILIKMGLPPHVVAAIREFHERQIKEQAAGMGANAYLLQVANLVAHGMLLTPSTHEPVRPISRTEWRAFAGDKLPPTIDPVAKRMEILSATNLLARLPAREEQRLLSPIIAPTALRVGYIRPPLFIELDSLAFALQLLATTTVLGALPTPDQLGQFDALVVLSIRPGVAPLLPADLARLTAAAGRPQMPILGVAPQETVPLPDAASVDLLQVPVSLAKLRDWLAGAMRTTAAAGSQITHP